MSTVLKDRYEIERELGRGGMSVVYLARDRQLMSKPVVIKVLLEETAADAWIRQKFQQEMEAMARIDHPGVIGVLDTGETPEGKQFLVMQYVEGANLRSALQPGGMELARAAELIRQMGQALAAAHDKGVWHRDLKPENVMLQRLASGDHIKLIDFGIAGIQNSAFGGEATKVAGSLTYMAPEQFAGHPCAASDTYALAVTAYEMVTGKKPFYPESMVHLASPEKARPAPPRELRPELPEEASQAILRAMSFQPEERPSPVSAFSEGLYRALTAEETVRLPPPVPPVHRSKLAWLAAGGVLLLAGAGAGGWLMRPQGKPLELEYSIQEQKPQEAQPRRLAGETVFDRNDRIALEAFSPETGYLYILDYAKDGATGAWTYNLLEPRPSASASHAAGEAVRVPSSGWFTFDAATGRETLYLVWAKHPISELEKLKMLPPDRGVIVVKDAAEMSRLSPLLAGAGKPTVKREADLTDVRTSRDMLVYPLQLEHL